MQMLRVCQQAAMSWSRDSVDGGCWQPHHSKYSQLLLLLIHFEIPCCSKRDVALVVKKEQQKMLTNSPTSSVVNKARDVGMSLLLRHIDKDWRWGKRDTREEGKHSQTLRQTTIQKYRNIPTQALTSRCNPQTRQTHTLALELFWKHPPTSSTQTPDSRKWCKQQSTVEQA